MSHAAQAHLGTKSRSGGPTIDKFPHSVCRKTACTAARTSWVQRSLTAPCASARSRLPPAGIGVTWRLWKPPSLGMAVAQGETKSATIETMKVDLAIPSPPERRGHGAESPAGRAPRAVEPVPVRRGLAGGDERASAAGQVVADAAQLRTATTPQDAHEGRGRTEQAMKKAILVIPCSGIGKVYGTAGLPGCRLAGG